jgi:hypothetical protein
VHFPIVLLLLGAAVAVAGVFFNRWHLAWVAAGLLVHRLVRHLYGCARADRG